MEWSVILFMALFAGTVVLLGKGARKKREHTQRVYDLGRRQGYFEGWVSHAKGTTLDSMPPRLQEIEDATEIDQGGWGEKGFYNYPDTDKLVQSGMLGNVSWEEWQARRLKELNEQYLGTSLKDRTEDK